MIKVSDITTYLRCPRMPYFTNKGYDLMPEITPGYIERMVLKELALTYGAAIYNENKLTFLKQELDRISNELPVIYRKELNGIDGDIIESSISGVRSFLEDISKNLSDNSGFYTGISVHMEPLLRSEKLGLIGTPDKLIQIKDQQVPSIIKTGNIPENGVWKNERIQLTAYAALVEEIYDNVVECGFVEYARSGKVREVKIKRHERRKVLQIRDRIKKIQDGFMPEKPENAPCSYCAFGDMCEDKTTLASRFF